MADCEHRRVYVDADRAMVHCLECGEAATQEAAALWPDITVRVPNGRRGYLRYEGLTHDTGVLFPLYDSVAVGRTVTMPWQGGRDQ